MNCFYKLLAFLFFLAGPFWYGPTVYTDVISPQAWNDPLHDPRWYLPLFAAIMVTFLVLVVYAWLTVRRAR